MSIYGHIIHIKGAKTKCHLQGCQK